MGLTGKGFGVPSQAVNITTGHQGDLFLKSLSLLSVFMLPRVGAVKHVGKSRGFCRKRLLEKMEGDKLTTIWQKRSRGPLLEDHTTY